MKLKEHLLYYNYLRYNIRIHNEPSDCGADIWLIVREP